MLLDPPRKMSPSSLAVSPSSPSSPSPPPSPRPFSLLPTELVQSIIESAVPHHFDYRHYRDRQSTLRSFCLVSKLFRQIANPLLLTVVQFSDAKVWKSWKRFKTKVWARVQDVTVGSDNGTYLVEAEVVKALAKSCRNLTTLSLCNCFKNTLDVSQLVCATREY